MAIVPDRIDKLVTIAHIVAIVGLFGLLPFGAVRQVEAIKQLQDR